MHQTSWLESLQGMRVRLALRRSRWPQARLWWGGALLALFVAALVSEFVGRAVGLHTPVLYEKTEYGFRPQPNQSIRRFGNHIAYDGLGLRSAAVAPVPAPGTLRLLFMGDSIVNGGARTDQSQTIPSLVQAAMTGAARPVEALNASSPGWAMANAAGWFHRHGTLGAHYVVLITNTYDLFQEEAPASVVGGHPAFPERGPGLALIELFHRYLWPRLIQAAAFSDPGADMAGARPVLTAQVLGDLRWILLRARSRGATGIVVLVEPVIPLDPSAQALGERALQALRRDLETLDIALVDTRDAMSRGGGPQLFRDGLHPTAAGNAVIAGVIAAAIERDVGGRH